MTNRLPSWFRQEIPSDAVLRKMHRLSNLRVNTVCQEAKCPNLSHCFNKSELTFLILGDICTRHCRFCAVKKSAHKLPGPDLDEPARLAALVKELKLNYAVITSVTRDDLRDGGAGAFAETIRLMRGLNQDIKIEALLPDFQGDFASLDTVIAASPDVAAHNIETVKRLYQDLRPQAGYRRSLAVLSCLKESNVNLTTKSAIMLGLGERKEEVIQAMQDLRDNYCDILTLGQYLAPSKEHYPVREFIRMEKFAEYKEIGLSLGFKAVLSGPLARSSYRAAEIYREFKGWAAATSPVSVNG